jgi:sugar-specific transcriptional regulator TrmB
MYINIHANLVKCARPLGNTSVSLENITKRFVDLGLSEEESAVLRDLYLAGESKAGDLARSSGLARIKVYRILDRLQEMNIVESTMGRPVIFSAITPDSAIERLIEHAARKLETMQVAREEVIKELARFKLQTRPQAEAKYRIIQGKQQIYPWIAKMAGSAASEILAYVERDDLRKIYYTDIPEELAKARKRGVKVKILTDVDYSLAATVKDYSGYADIRHTKIPGMSILLVVDESELVVSATTRAEGAADVALWMNGKNFVAGIKGLLGESWENAISAQTRINIMKEGGKALQDILIVKGTQSIGEFYKSMLSRAKRQVLHISVPYDTELFGTLASDSLAWAGRKVEMQVLTAIDGSSLGDIKDLGKRCKVRHVDAKAGVNITIMDGEEVMLTPAAGGGAKSRGQSAIWSNVRDYVEHYRIMFDNLWSSSAAMADRIALLEAQEKVAKMASSMRQTLEGAGFKIQNVVKGASGLVHEFSIAATGEHGTVVLVDVAGPEKPDLQAAVIGFVVKCMDVKADHKLLVTLLDPVEIQAPARSLHSGITVAGAGDAEKTLRKMLGIKQQQQQVTTTALID